MWIGCDGKAHQQLLRPLGRSAGLRLACAGFAHCEYQPTSKSKIRRLEYETGQYWWRKWEATTGGAHGIISRSATSFARAIRAFRFAAEVAEMVRPAFAP